jgi:hypothetical protein
MRLLRCSFVVLLYLVVIWPPKVLAAPATATPQKSEAQVVDQVAKQDQTISFDLLVKGDAQVLCPKGWMVTQNPYMPLGQINHEINFQGICLLLDNGLPDPESELPSLWLGAAAYPSSTRQQSERLMSEIESKWKKNICEMAEANGATNKPAFQKANWKVNRLNGQSYTAVAYKCFWNDTCSRAAFMFVVVGDQCRYEDTKQHKDSQCFPVYFGEYYCSQKYWKQSTWVMDKVIGSLKVP